MVLILSQHDEASTDKVMDWLSYIGTDYYRLNTEDVLDNNSTMSYEFNAVENISKNLMNSLREITFLGVKSIWFRKCAYKDFIFQFRNNICNALKELEFEKEIFNKNIIPHLSNEYSYLRNAIYSSIENEDVKKLGNNRFAQSSINKIEVLNLAQKCKLDIPATLITNSKSDLNFFIKRYKKIITKAISVSLVFQMEKANQIEEYGNYTEEITEESIKNIPDTFFYSLFQEKLDKEIEIRVFFLDHKCYSMAIFSQLNSQTNVDFRKCTTTVRNRFVPYQLPKILESRIKELMKNLDLNTGSIDMVKTKDNRFVFLEVNPVGQYGMTSVPCNYYIDKKIAEYLTIPG